MLERIHAFARRASAGRLILALLTLAGYAPDMVASTLSRIGGFMRVPVLAAAVAFAALVPSDADACAVKANDVAIVLGLAGDDVVVMRLSLHRVEVNEGESRWEGEATLHVGARALGKVGDISTTAEPDKELTRLVGVARRKAKAIDGFVLAREATSRDCSEKPSVTCGDVAIESAGKQLRVGKTKVKLDAKIPDVDPENLEVIGVVRYTSGSTEIAVVNVGVGDPRFSQSLPLCEGARCRDITTLHHGQQRDVIVVVR